MAGQESPVFLAQGEHIRAHAVPGCSRRHQNPCLQRVIARERVVNFAKQFAIAEPGVISIFLL
jgi:hypothetical protein